MRRFEGLHYVVATSSSVVVVVGLVVVVIVGLVVVEVYLLNSLKICLYIIYK